jgi:hypothetical protein
VAKVISIFLDCNDPLSEVVSRIAPVLGVKFKEFAADGLPFYEGRSPDWIATISRHGYENDRDLNFEDFMYEIGFRAIRDVSYEQHERNTRSDVKELFERLKPVLKCDMMLVDNLQRKLAEHHAGVVS